VTEWVDLSIEASDLYLQNAGFELLLKLMKLFGVSFVFQASYWKPVSQYAINTNSYSFFNS